MQISVLLEVVSLPRPGVGGSAPWVRVTCWPSSIAVPAVTLDRKQLPSVCHSHASPGHYVRSSGLGLLVHL